MNISHGPFPNCERSWEEGMCACREEKKTSSPGKMRVLRTHFSTSRHTTLRHFHCIKINAEDSLLRFHKVKPVGLSKLPVPLTVAPPGESAIVPGPHWPKLSTFWNYYWALLAWVELIPTHSLLTKETCMIGWHPPSIPSVSFSKPNEYQTLLHALVNARQELWLAGSVFPPVCQGLWNPVLRPWLVRMDRPQPSVVPVTLYWSVETFHYESPENKTDCDLCALGLEYKAKLLQSVWLGVLATWGSLFFLAKLCVEVVSHSFCLQTAGDVTVLLDLVTGCEPGSQTVQLHLWHVCPKLTGPVWFCLCICCSHASSVGNLEGCAMLLLVLWRGLAEPSVWSATSTDSALAGWRRLLCYPGMCSMDEALGQGLWGQSLTNN